MTHLSEGPMADAQTTDTSAEAVDWLCDVISVVASATSTIYLHKLDKLPIFPIYFRRFALSYRDDIFADNLRLLKGIKTVTQLAREIPMNRTQLNRYLSSESLPNVMRLRQLCRYFGVDERIVSLPLAEIKLIDQSAKRDAKRVQDLERALEQLACKHETSKPLWWQEVARAALNKVGDG